MPEKIKESLSLGLNVPLYWLVTFLATGIFSAGMIYNKLEVLVELSAKTETKLAGVQEKQIGGLAAIEVLKTTAQAHEGRIANLESAVRSVK